MTVLFPALLAPASTVISRKLTRTGIFADLNPATSTAVTFASSLVAVALALARSQSHRRNSMDIFSRNPAVDNTAPPPPIGIVSEHPKSHNAVHRVEIADDFLADQISQRFRRAAADGAIPRPAIEA